MKKRKKMSDFTFGIILTLAIISAILTIFSIIKTELDRIEFKITKEVCEEKEVDVIDDSSCVSGCAFYSLLLNRSDLKMELACFDRCHNFVIKERVCKQVEVDELILCSLGNKGGPEIVELNKTNESNQFQIKWIRKEGLTIDWLVENCESTTVIFKGIIRSTEDAIFDDFPDFGSFDLFEFKCQDYLVEVIK